MRKVFTTAAAAAIAALVSLPASAQSATDQAGSQPGSGATSGTSATGTSGTQSGSETGTSTEAKTHAGASSATAKGSSRMFLTEAAEGGLAEVQLGQLATQKASNDDVKKFGQMMVDDHSKANDKLKEVAQKANVTVPSDLSAKDKRTYDQLSKLSGEAFDRAYMRHMVADHTKDVAAFKKAANSASDPDVKQFASDTLPTLEKHLNDAKDISKKVGAAPMTSNTAGHHKATGTSGNTESPSGTSAPARPPQQ